MQKRNKANSDKEFYFQGAKIKLEMNFETSKVSKMIIWQYNILEFKREAEQGSQSEFCLAYQNQK